MNKLVLTAVGVMTASQAMAAGLDFSAILAAVDVSTVSVALVAMAALKAGPNVAKWAANKLAGFFGR